MESRVIEVEEEEKREELSMNLFKFIKQLLGEERLGIFYCVKEEVEGYLYEIYFNVIRESVQVIVYMK